MLTFSRTMEKLLHFATLSGESRTQAAAFLKAEGGGGREVQQQSWTGSCLPVPCSILPLPSKAPTQCEDSCLSPSLPW